MQQLNYTIFEAINATEESHPALLAFGEFAAVYLIYLVPTILVVGWLVGDDRLRRILLEAFVAILVGLGISAVIGWVWPHPRPFVAGVGNTFIEYDATPSFPSNHAGIMLTMACSFVLHPRTRRMGAAFLAVSLTVVWARMYIGVHWPMDMVGAIVLSAAVAGAVAHWHRWLITPVYDRVVRPLFQWLFSPLIRRGWIRE